MNFSASIHVGQISNDLTFPEMKTIFGIFWGPDCPNNPASLHFNLQPKSTPYPWLHPPQAPATVGQSVVQFARASNAPRQHLEGWPHPGMIAPGARYPASRCGVSECWRSSSPLPANCFGQKRGRKSPSKIRICATVSTKEGGFMKMPNLGRKMMEKLALRKKIEGIERNKTAVIVT